MTLTSITFALLTFVGIARPKREIPQRKPMPEYRPKFGDADARPRREWTYDVPGPDYWAPKADRSEPPLMDFVDLLASLSREKQLYLSRLLRHGYSLAVA